MPAVIFLDHSVEMAERPPLALEPITALRAALAYQGLDVDLDTLRALSGEAWAPLLHVNASIREPVLHLQPLDCLTRACDALSVESAWHTELSAEEVIALTSEEIGAQRPVLVSFLHRPIEDPGWNLLIGVEPEGRRLQLHDVRLARQRRVVPIERLWSGPVPGPQRWVDTPLFTADVTAASTVPDALQCLTRAVEGWAAQADVASLELPSHRGARSFGRDDPAGLVATVGPEAARHLGDEIWNVDSLDDFGVLWRARSLLPQFAGRRDAAARFLRGLHISDPQIAAQCEEAADALATTAVTARVASALMWDTSLSNITVAGDLLDRVKVDPALVVDIEEMPAHERRLLAESIERFPQAYTMRIHSTPWGAALTVDSPAQRDRILELLETLADQMEAADAELATLAQMLGVNTD